MSIRCDLRLCSLSHALRSPGRPEGPDLTSSPRRLRPIQREPPEQVPAESNTGQRALGEPTPLCVGGGWRPDHGGGRLPEVFAPIVDPAPRILTASQLDTRRVAIHPDHLGHSRTQAAAQQPSPHPTSTTARLPEGNASSTRGGSGCCGSTAQLAPTQLWSVGGRSAVSNRCELVRHSPRSMRLYNGRRTQECARSANRL